MATTTNYGWTTPDDTSLVKDGAAAIRTLGSSVDTTTKALNPSTTLGDIEYRSATANTNTRLGIGTTGQILTVTGGVPVWSTPATAGGMTLISETTASALSSLSLSSIAGTYKQLLLMWSGVNQSTTGSNLAIRLNNDSNSIYQINEVTFANGTSQDAYSLTSIRGGFGGPFGINVTTADLFGAAQGFLLIDNYSSSTKLKAFSCEWAYTTSAPRNDFVNVRGVFNSTTAITSIDIVRLTGTATFSNITNTSIRLYGIS